MRRAFKVRCGIKYTPHVNNSQTNEGLDWLTRKERGVKLTEA